LEPLQNNDRVIPLVVTRKISTERISAQIDQLGPLPSIAMEAVAIADNPRSSVKHLEAEISKDPIITARVFKVANSFFHSKGIPVQSLHDASTRLGMRTVKNIVLSTCAGQMMARRLHNYGYDDFGMWVHCMGLGLMAVQLAPFLGVSTANADDLLLAGMMHDIGKLVMDGVLDRQISCAGLGGLDVEREILGLDHTQVGTEIAHRWKLPEFVIGVVGNHHAPTRAKKHEDLVAAICLSDFILNRLGVGHAKQTEIDKEPLPAVLEILSLAKNDVEAIEDEAQKHLAGILSFCKETLPSAKHS